MINSPPSFLPHSYEYGRIGGILTDLDRKYADFGGKVMFLSDLEGLGGGDY